VRKILEELKADLKEVLEVLEKNLST
jgi:hypothetical protein